MPVGLDTTTAGTATSWPPRSPDHAVSSPENPRAARTLACHSRSLSTSPCSRKRTSCVASCVPSARRPERGVVLPWSSRSFHAVRCALTVAGNCSASQCSETRSLPTTTESNRLMPHLRPGRSASRTRTIGSGRALRDSTSSWAWVPCRSIRRRTRVACAGASCAARASERLRQVLIALAASRRGSLRVPARSRFSVSM